MRCSIMVILVAAAIAVAPQVVGAEVTVDEVSLAEDVQNRDPVGSLPGAGCEMASNGHSSSNGEPIVPVVDASLSSRVYFWNRLKSDNPGTLRHTWYMNRDQGWREAAEVDLTYSASPGYRTWSSKELDRSLHAGDWKIEVTSTSDPEHVLCTTRFRVE